LLLFKKDELSVLKALSWNNALTKHMF